MAHYRKKMNPREVIDDNIEGLVESIDVKNTTLWEKLIELKLFTSSDVQHIKVSKSLFYWIWLIQNVETLVLNYDFKGGIFKCNLFLLPKESPIDFSFQENNSSNRDQVREILNRVIKGGISSYQVIKQALIDTGQGGVTERYLCEIENPEPDSQSKD